MSNPIAIQKSRQGKLRFVEKVYGLLTIHEPYLTSDGELADKLRLPKQDAQNARLDLVEVGSLRTEKVNPTSRAQGFKTRWTLVEPVNVTKARLEAKYRQDDLHTTELLRQPNPAKAVKNLPGETPAAKAARLAALGIDHKGVLAGGSTGWTNGANFDGATVDHPVLPSVLVASSGPEPALKPLSGMASARHDEPRALIEAARHYHDVNAQLDQKVKELEALGMTVDRIALGKAIKAPHDQTLLIVSQVLPYVDNLERQVERLTNQNNDLRDKVANLPELNQRVNRLHSQNERLVAENTAMRSQLHERGQSAPQIKPKPEVAATAGKA